MPPLRDIRDDDLEVVLALNNEHAAEVNSLTLEQLRQMVEIATRARIVEGGLGFLVAFDETTPPQGPNHAWFLARQPAFVYIDRIVVAADGRRRGLADGLYRDLVSVAAGRPLC